MAAICQMQIARQLKINFKGLALELTLFLLKLT